MAAKLRELLDSYARNLRFMHYDIKVVLDPFGEPVTTVERIQSQATAIVTDPHLTREGKNARGAKAGTETLEALAKWHAP